MTAILLLVVVAAVAAALLFVPALKSWRTMIWNGLVIAAGFLLPLAIELVGYFGTLDWTQYATPDTVKWIMLVLGVMGIVLRLVTTTPVGTKK